MKIDLDWIQKELDAGREVELECVDREGYEKRHCLNKTLFREGSCLEVLEVWDDGAINLKRLVDSPMDGLHLIPPHEFGHFRIKRPTPTFNDLIDVAVQGVKDNIIVINHFDIDAISAVSLTNRKISFEEWRCRSSDKDIIDAINLIESLYTETFVIEEDGDISKLKGEPNISLANGNEFVAKNMKIGSNSRGMFAISFIDIDGYEMTYSFFELKGAKVTQQKGNK